MKGIAFAFRRKAGPPIGNGGLAGHCGWAFVANEAGDQICCGATENPKWHPFVPAGGDNGAWIEVVGSVEEMEQLMRRRLYDDYKAVPLPIVFPEAAKRAAENNAAIGYSVGGNNCLDHAYQVLCQYGAITLPEPWLHPIPNAWFSAAAGEYHSLHAK